MSPHTPLSSVPADGIPQQSDSSETDLDANVIDFVTTDQVNHTVMPAIVSQPNAEKLNEYSEWTRYTDGVINSDAMVTHATLNTLVAFCALVHLGLGETKDERFNRGFDWAKRRDLGTVRSKYGAANTVAALLNLDIAHKDKEVAKRNRSRIDRDAAAIDGLLRHMEGANMLDNVPALFAPSGIQKVAAIIVTNGGVESLSKQQRAFKAPVVDDETGETYKAIELDSQKVKAICSEKAEKELTRLAGGTEGQVSILVASMNESKVKGYREVFPRKSVRDDLLADVANVPRQVELLGQTVLLGQAVHEEKSELLVNQKDDKRDQKAPRRMAYRQMILLTDGTILVSGILLPSRVVVKVKPKPRKTGAPVFEKFAGDLVVRTAGRKFLELNLIDDHRRRVFNAYINPNKNAGDNPNYPLSIVGSTKAAKEGTQNTFYAELQKADTFPQQSLLCVDDTTIKAHATGHISQFIFNEIAEKRLTSIKSEKSAPAVNLRVFNDGFTVECGKIKTSHGVSSKVTKPNKGNAVDVYINKADFVEVFNAVALLPVTGSVAFTIDFDGLVKFSFETWVGYFEVFVPTSSQGGERRHTHFRNLTPTPWPVEAEVTKADTTATSDTSEA